MGVLGPGRGLPDEQAVGGSSEAFDGVAEIWVELLEDERNLIDLASSPIWVGEENPVVD